MPAFQGHVTDGELAESRVHRMGAPAPLLTAPLLRLERCHHLPWPPARSRCAKPANSWPENSASAPSMVTEVARLVRARVAHEVGDQVRELPVLAEPARRDAAQSLLLELRPRHQAAEGPSVGNGPGAIALVRMPYTAHSTASERIIASTPRLGRGRGQHERGPAVGVATMTTERISPSACARSAVGRSRWSRGTSRQSTICTTLLNAFGERSWRPPGSCRPRC